MSNEEVRAPLKDTVVAAVIQQFIERSEVGQQKYGTTLDRIDLKPLDWVQHAQEELMDGILYLEKLKRIIKASRLLEDTLSEGITPAPSKQK
jgi:hypothetical protein